MTITVNIDDAAHEIECFGENGGIETFIDYTLRVVLPIFEESVTLTTLRCSISGFPIGRIDTLELADMVRHGVASLKLSKWNDILNPPTPAQCADAIETLADHMEVRMFAMARPGPALNYKLDRLSESKLSRPRQLAILLNQLLWDGGMFRDRAISLEDTTERNRKSAKVADQIIQNWDSDETLADLHSGLIELDAKYRITKLNLYRAELNRLFSIRDSKSVTTDDLLKFVMDLIEARDSREFEPVLEPHRWSQEVYRNDMEYSVNARPERSNLTIQPTKKEQEQAERMTPEGKAKEMAKKVVINRFEDAFAAAFGAPKNV